MAQASDLTTGLEFEIATATQFGFLEREYSFRRSPARCVVLGSQKPDWEPLTPDRDGLLSDRVVLVEFEASQVIVHITYDPNSELTVQLTWRGQAEPNRADLWHLMSFVAAEELTRSHWRGTWGEIKIRDDLASLAGALRRYGQPWLEGDPLRWRALFEWWSGGMPQGRRPA